ncbi:MAG: hypothetical protein D6703_00940 [Zetaproteobacteria bacterium]|nr:MAG: hypothetical protein D6703_00940 [Zetaproteobacteria bacterium]
MKNTRRILCAGIPRSGSTWMYNIIRLMLLRSGAEVYGAWIEDYQPETQADWHVVKVHEPLDESWLEKAELIFCSHRDLRDIAVSSIRMGWAKENEEVLFLLEKIVNMHHFWSSHAAFELHYEDLLDDPARVASAIAGVLGMTLDGDAIRQLCQKVDALNNNGKAEHDPVTLLHPDHRQSGRYGRYRTELPASLTQQIELQFGPWLIEHGYLELSSWMQAITKAYRFLYQENLGLKTRIHELEKVMRKHTQEP